MQNVEWKKEKDVPLGKDIANILDETLKFVEIFSFPIINLDYYIERDEYGEDEILSQLLDTPM